MDKRSLRWPWCGAMVAAALVAAGVLELTAAAGDPGAPRGRWEEHRAPALAVLQCGEWVSGAIPISHLSGGDMLVAVPAGAPAGEATLEAWSSRRAILPALDQLAAGPPAVHAGGTPVILGLAPGIDVEAVARRLDALGADVSWIIATGLLPQFGISVPAHRLAPVVEGLRDLPGLVWADVQGGARLRNSESVWRCQSGMHAVTPIFDRGIRGHGQVIGIMDTGIDIDHCRFGYLESGLPALNDRWGLEVAPDNSKVLAVDFYWDRDWPDPGPDAWDDNGHGSHVAGSAAGDLGGDGFHQGADGMAPAARLVIQDGGFGIDNCADLPGLGCPLQPLESVFEQAYDQGARIHSNSWGDEENFTPYNRYTERTADVDRFVWHHRDLLVLFAAGNSGPTFDSVGSPATGKNVIAVGAALRGSIEPPCVAPFSSRGWTHDGRVKPDLVAPGSAVISVASDGNIETDNCDNVAKWGTSMACPTAAGLAALVRQYFVDGFHPSGTPRSGDGFEPSAALVKAVLIASGVDLTSLGCSGIDPIPSRDQGWGLIQLDRALAFPESSFRLQVEDGVHGFESQGTEAFLKTLRVPVQGPLKVVLVWTDPPSSSLAESNLVNDLDLVVHGPDGSYLGNQFSGGISVCGGNADDRNNVEVVWLPVATPGGWTITVDPRRIVEGPQDFALAVVGRVAEGTPAPRRAGGRRGPGGPARR